MATQKKNNTRKVTAKKAVKKATKKTAAKKAFVKKTVAKKAPVKKAVAKKVATKKATKKTAAKKASVKKTIAKKAPVKKAVAKKAVTKKAAKKTAVKKASVKKTVAKKTPAKKAPKSATKKTVNAKPAASKPNKKASTKAKISKSVQLNSDQSEKSDTSRSAPIVFSLEEVEALVANRKEDTSETTTKVVKKKAPTKAVKVKPVKVQKHAAASIADILGFNPNQKKSFQNISEKDIPAKWKKYYKLLLELRDHIKEELALHTSETLKQSSKDNSGDLSGYGSHQADAGTETFDRDFALGILSNEQDALNEIEEAIYRIKDGTYGVCEETGKPINKERLTVVPFTRYSLDGQIAFEKNNRKRRNKVMTGLFEDNSDSVNIAGDSDDE